MMSEERNTRYEEAMKGGYDLSNSYCARGDDLEEFKTAVKEICEATSFKVLTPSKDAKFYSFNRVVCQTGEDEKTRENAIFLRLTEDAVRVFNETGYLTENREKPGLQRDRLSSFQIDEENRRMVQEMKDSVHMIMTLGGNKTWIFPQAVADMLQISGIKGDGAVTDKSLSRDLFLADRFSRFCKPLTFVIRSVKSPYGDTTDKLFAVLSGKYKPVSMDLLWKAVELLETKREMGAVVTRSWRVDQTYTDLFVEFPEMAEDFAIAYGLEDDDAIIPGIRLSTSDLGQSSLSIEATYRRAGSGRAIISDESVKRKHLGEKLTGESILADVETEIFPKLRSFPMALIERMGVQIGDADLTTVIGRKDNFKIILRCIKAGLYACDLHKVLGKKRKKILLDKLAGEIRTDLRYTEYDLAMLFMTLPDRIDTGSETEHIAIGRCCGKAANIEYLSLARKLKDEPENEDIYISDADTDEVF